MKWICLITEPGVKLAACHISHIRNYRLTIPIRSPGQSSVVSERVTRMCECVLRESDTACAHVL